MSPRSATPQRRAARIRRMFHSLGSISPGWRLTILGLLVAVAAVCFLLLFVRGSWDFAVPRRLTMLGAIVVAAFAQGVGTVVFHTITNNRILTPSIIGFDSMYTLMQTLMVFVFGGTVIAATEELPKVVAQTVVMVLFATILYRWLFSGRFGSLYILLLVGVVLGMAFDSIATFLQRLLSPTEYDLLSVELFGRLSDVNASSLPLAFTVCAAVALVLWQRRNRLDALLLGRDAATAIGVGFTRELTLMLSLVAVLVAFSTALVGPMTFFGFLVANLAYKFAGSHRHAIVMPMAFLLGLFALIAGQFVVQHIFAAGGFLTVIIEFVGGILFLIMLLRKGTL